MIQSLQSDQFINSVQLSNYIDKDSAPRAKGRVVLKELLESSL